MIASERDFAISQMREMAEQVQTIASEFKSMANHSDHLLKQLNQVLENTFGEWKNNLHQKLSFKLCLSRVKAGLYTNLYTSYLKPGPALPHK